MLGGLMIADFRFDPVPNENDVVVDLFWDQSDRMGRIIVPAGVEDARAVAFLPDLEPMPAISAVAYAMVLAAESNCRLRLTGDPTVWPTQWGTLLQAH